MKYSPPRDRGVPTLEQLDDLIVGDMEKGELFAMFQPMIDSGIIWHFPRPMIQAAVTLINNGVCMEKQK